MGIVERLTLEAAAADTMLACEHRQRYLFAASLCRGLHVLDLCCGSGYGSSILAEHAETVVGVDNDAATVELAAATIGAGTPNVSFELADAVSFVRSDLTARFDVVVCFEGLEHLPDLDGVIGALREHAERGLRLIASIPNGRLFREENPFHVTEFGYDEARQAFAAFPEATMLPQFLAEGSLICPPDADGTDVTVAIQDRLEPEYANHFIFTVNVPSQHLGAVHHGRLQLNASPVFNRFSEDLKLAARALRRENARLARGLLGRGGSAAAASLAAVQEHEAERARLRAEATAAHARCAELESLLTRRDGVIAEQRAPVTTPLIEMEPVVLEPMTTGGDPGSWEHRHRAAASCLVPWVQRTVPLQGKTVLAFGCGDAAIACAFAARCEQLIGLDIDADAIAEAHTRVERAGLRNVTLEHHARDRVELAVSSRIGEPDVVVLAAVLEQMTVPERLEVLRLARSVLAPGGVIVVCETPNRLLAFDAQGFGASFHEFEAVFGDLSQHVIGSSYDPRLIAVRPIRPQEIALARCLGRERPDLAPAWSRAWLDVILSSEPVTGRASLIRPWTTETTGSRGVAWTGSDTIRLSGPDATLAVALPHPTSRLLVGVTADGGSAARLLAQPRGGAVTVAAEGRGPSGSTVLLELVLPAPAAEIDLASARPAELVFVGYED